MALILAEETEYTITFEKKPFGMVWASRKSDRNNLYVTKIDADSPAFYKNVITGSKLIAFEDSVIEDLGAKEIFWRYKNRFDDTLPLHIKFRKPETDPASPKISRNVSVYQHYEPNKEAIEFPVDCGENAMKYSLPSRLQEAFIAVLQYMAKAQNTSDEWLSFIAANDYQILTRFAKTTKRLLEAEIETFEDAAYNKEEEKEEDDKKSSAFGWLCVILKMFGDLDVVSFIDILTQYAFKNIILSFKHHSYLSRQDLMNRLDLIEWIIIHNSNLSEYIAVDIDDGSEIFINYLCEILNANEYKDVIEIASKSLIYGIARKHKSEIRDALCCIQDRLSDDSFRHFTEFYFDLLNNQRENIAEFELLIEFNAFVFRYNLYDFYFSSDIKILIDIYIQSFHNCEPSSKQLLLCLDGAYNILRWKSYANKLEKYKLDEMLDVLSNELKKTVAESSIEFKNQKETKEIKDILALIHVIEHKLNTILETLHAIKEDKYDYEKEQTVIKVPVDISQYSLNTKSMKQLQKDLLELLYFLSHNKSAADEWILFLTANNCEIYTRFCVLVIRLLKNEKKYVSNEAHDEKEDMFDETQLFPLTTLCELLVIFASLDASQFTKMIKLRVLNPLRVSLSYADKLQNKKDVLIRLKVLFFMINNDDSLQIAPNWFFVLCNLLSDRRNDDDEDEILLITTKCISFFIGKMNDSAKQKQFLLHLQKKLKNPNDFRHFVEIYIKLINDIKINKWNHLSTKLLIDFVICVMKQQFTDFFYSSDVKILCEIYLRCVTNIDCEMDPKGFQMCLNGIKTLNNWIPYREDAQHALFKYKSDEIRNQLKEKETLINNVEITANINEILNM